MSMLLTEIADKCDQYIKAAEADGVVIDDGNVVDLCADQSCMEGDCFALSVIREALVVAGYGERFVKSTRQAVVHQTNPGGAS